MIDYLKQQIQNNGFSVIMVLVVGFMAFTMVRKLMGTASDEEIRAYLNSQDVSLFDVRSRSEFSGGSFPGAINIPVDQISSSSSRLPRDKNSKIIVFCASGMRSSSAQSTLKQMGYVNVLNGGGVGNVLRFRNN